MCCQPRVRTSKEQERTAPGGPPRTPPGTIGIAASGSAWHLVESARFLAPSAANRARPQRSECWPAETRARPILRLDHHGLQRESARLRRRTATRPSPATPLHSSCLAGRSRTCPTARGESESPASWSGRPTSLDEGRRLVPGLPGVSPPTSVRGVLLGGSDAGSDAGDVGGEEVDAVAVEVAAGAVVVLGGAGVGVAGEDLGVAEWDPGVEGVGDRGVP